MTQISFAENSYEVTTESKKVKLLVVDYKDGVPAAFALMGTKAVHKVAIRIGGGCKGMSTEDKEQMIKFFSWAFTGYHGVVWSGGTRAVTKEGKIDPMVTEVPAVIAEENPGAIALGTAPRVDIMTLQENSRLVLDEYGTVPNPAQEGVLIVQNGADGSLDWDGDVDMYIQIMKQWRDYAGFEKLALITWNGGEVTRKEIEKAAKLGWLVILIKGSGRVTDEVITKLEAGDTEIKEKLGGGQNVLIVSKDDPQGLRASLIQNGLIN